MITHFKVQLDRPIDGAREACVEIDRRRSLVTVRPFRRRTSYTVTLATVADLAVWRVLRFHHAGVIVPKRRASL
jgi:hypothetical protein